MEGDNELAEVPLSQRSYSDVPSGSGLVYWYLSKYIVIITGVIRNGRAIVTRPLRT
jgi:hypothetical protein